MSAPFDVNSVFRSTVVDDNSDHCLKIKKVLSFLPLKLYQLFNWMWNGTEISDAFRSQLWPAGSVILTATQIAPVGHWLKCDGTSYLRSEYPDLFNAIGSSFGSADGTHFNVPDLCGRPPVCSGTLKDADGNSGGSYAFGSKYGNEEVVLQPGSVPAPPISPDVERFILSEGSSIGENNSLTGAGDKTKRALPSEVFDSGEDVEGHDNVSPVLAMNYWIAY
jgi:microcystin-dependent protein